MGRRLSEMFHHSVGRKQVRAGLHLPALLPLTNSPKSHSIMLTGQSMRCGDCSQLSQPFLDWNLCPTPGYLYEPGHGNTFQETVLELPDSMWNKTNGPYLTPSTKIQFWVKTYLLWTSSGRWSPPLRAVVRLGPSKPVVQLALKWLLPFLFL